MRQKSKIAVLKFKNEYNPPSGGTLYVHEIQMEDASFGTLYLKSMDYFKEGMEVEYEMINGKIRVYKLSEPSSKKPKGGYAKEAHKITYYLGYAYGYAKDIAIEEAKLSKSKEIDLDRMEVIAERVYNHMESLFNKDNE